MAEDPSHRAVIAVDIGGTSIKSGIVCADGQLLSGVRQTAVDSSGAAAPILTILYALIATHLAELNAPPKAVALGVPGPFDYASGRSLMRDGKFGALYSQSLRETIAGWLPQPDIPILFRNDAEAAVVGEARYGAGRPFTRLLGVTLGTGLGSAFVQAGTPVYEAPGIPPRGELYAVEVAGATADAVFSIRGLTEQIDQVSNAPTIADAANLARADNEALRNVFAHFGAQLGAFLQPFALAFKAEAVLVLGGIANSIDLFGPALRQQLALPVCSGELSQRAALLGAARLVFEAEEVRIEP